MTEDNDKTEFVPTKIEDEEKDGGTIFPGDAGTGVSGKVLTGILVSYSKDGLGEIFNIYLGANSIGSANSNDIILNEQSVSKIHANINVRRMRKDNSLVYELKDSNSTTGTILNNKDHSEYNNYMKLKDEDILEIGAYKIIFKSFDPELLELSKNEDFKIRNSGPNYAM
jgi:pSer/pThr/pTyr-binding forkhead associated (FHA) protein